jgi:rhamnopyranosyl-N-acetylglucosaminyl-diphospho-decaprenol beta-1,3/1,4-galactofuranosyltransferase
MPESIAAVVVTYNRKALLGECLDALLKQTHPLDAIYVIDNASTDGTKEFLNERGYLRESKIRYVPLPDNTGGAGGFYEGLRHAFEAGFDWFWLMDDDVEPYLDGLEQLYQFSTESHCIHGRKTGPDGSAVPWGEWFDSRAVVTRPIKDGGFINHPRCQEVNVGCFEGMLVARDVVAKIGYPCREFFIMWDDTFYGYLASRVTRVLYANVLSLKRKRSIQTVDFLGERVTFTPLAAYYYQRNRFLIARKLDSVGPAFLFSTVYWGIRTMAKDLFLTKDLARVSASARGLLDGMRELGRR